MKIDTILVGITMSLLLLALPAAASDYTLGVFGNANGDDTINMADVTYTELIIFDYKDATELADAKYDGDINILDMTQIALIILEREKELTILDSADRIVTVQMPLKKVFISSYTVETLRSLKADLSDTMVGATTLDPLFFPEFSDVPQIPVIKGGVVDDTEAVLNLDPDVVIFLNVDPEARAAYEAAGITVIVFGVNKLETYAPAIKIQGYLFDRTDEAGEFVDWYETILDAIEADVASISDEDKPKVYTEGAHKPFYASTLYPVARAGGKNIFEIDGVVDAEALIDRDPHVIVKGVSRMLGGYGVDADDTAEFEAIRREMMNRSQLEGVTAVKEKEVYVMSHRFASWQSISARPFLQVIYMAKWFQPVVFKDLNPQAIHQEYLTEFQGLDIDLNDKGVFVYPLEGHLDGD